MRIAITGASGYVGSQIIPLLVGRGVTPVLLGRDPESLRARYPALDVAGYEAMAGAFAGADAVLHLAVMNNDVQGTAADFRAVNVDLLQEVVEAARAANVGRVIHTATLHASNGAATPYAATKREAEAWLATLTDPVVVTLRLPAVHGTRFAGKLGRLNKLPAPFRGALFQVLAALRPTVHAGRLATAIIEAAGAETTHERIVSDRQEGNRVYAAVTRLIDLAFAVFIIVCLWWLMLAMWAAVRLTSPGPGIFAQERIGRGGRPFTCYKFRTMRHGTKQAGTHEVGAAQVTPVGRFLRASKIDEFPQAWNILRNEMSLVGPRPCLPVQTALIDARQRRGVLMAKGGITGWSQIRNVDMSDPEQLAALDAQYLDLRTLPLDLKIILRTAVGGGRGDNVGR